MTKDQVLAMIQVAIVANDNNEITADVLRPIMEAMVSQPNDVIGVLTDLSTIEQTNIVAAINELSQDIQNLTGVVVHTGQNDPNTTPPDEFSVTDHYLQTSGSTNIALWQYTGIDWVRISANKNIIPLGEAFIFKNEETAPGELKSGDYVMKVIDHPEEGRKLFIAVYNSGDVSEPENYTIKAGF